MAISRYIINYNDLEPIIKQAINSIIVPVNPTNVDNKLEKVSINTDKIIKLLDTEIKPLDADMITLIKEIVSIILLIHRDIEKRFEELATKIGESIKHISEISSLLFDCYNISIDIVNSIIRVPGNPRIKGHFFNVKPLQEDQSFLMRFPMEIEFTGFTIHQTAWMRDDQFSISIPGDGGLENNSIQNLILTGPDSFLYLEAVPGKFIDRIVFDVPPVAGHYSNNDYGEIELSMDNENWITVTKVKTTNGIILEYTNADPRYRYARCHYYTDHNCMYNKSNIIMNVTYIVEYTNIIDHMYTNELGQTKKLKPLRIPGDYPINFTYHNTSGNSEQIFFDLHYINYVDLSIPSFEPDTPPDIDIDSVEHEWQILVIMRWEGNKYIDIDLSVLFEKAQKLITFNNKKIQQIVDNNDHTKDNTAFLDYDFVGRHHSEDDAYKKYPEIITINNFKNDIAHVFIHFYNFSTTSDRLDMPIDVSIYSKSSQYAIPQLLKSYAISYLDTIDTVNDVARYFKICTVNLSDQSITDVMKKYNSREV